MSDEPQIDSDGAYTCVNAASFSAANSLDHLDTASAPSVSSDDVHCARIYIANVCFIRSLEHASDWLLVDSGVFHAADHILRKAEMWNGSTEPPKAIILTHGHFDHVGALQALAEHWDVPVYAHLLEFPYLTGGADYPAADPSVGGGLMTWLSPFYPRDPVDISGRLQPLPMDGKLPWLPEWQWVHTPGHTPGHISLFRQSDGALIAGDAFITVKQESAWSVLTQAQELHGPPAYFTPDWATAWSSVRLLQALHPTWAATGHGRPMGGAALADGLALLARDFDKVAIPPHGRYVH